MDIETTASSKKSSSRSPEAKLAKEVAELTEQVEQIQKTLKIIAINQARIVDNQTKIYELAGGDSDNDFRFPRIPDF